MKEPDIVLVGTGNVATHLARALRHRIIAICSRTPEHARDLAETVGVGQWGTLADARSFKPSLIIVSVADNAIDSLVAAIGKDERQPLVMHTSGSVPKERLEPISPRTGVLYPLQTFSRQTDVDMSKVPFFTEAAFAEDYAAIDSLAQEISGICHHADASQRRKLHIAGVFSSNFIVEMLYITQKVLGTESYPLDTVRPLVEATVAKVFEVGPHDAITGPAIRGDKAVMEAQSNALEGDEKAIYDLVSNYIIKTHDVRLK